MPSCSRGSPNSLPPQVQIFGEEVRHAAAAVVAVVAVAAAVAAAVDNTEEVPFVYDSIAEVVSPGQNAGHRSQLGSETFCPMMLSVRIGRYRSRWER